jgi:hypothetical protein
VGWPTLSRDALRLCDVDGNDLTGPAWIRVWEWDSDAQGEAHLIGLRKPS